MNRNRQKTREYQNVTDFVQALLNGKISPEHIRELFIPTVKTLSEFAAALRKEIDSSTKLSEDLIAAIKVIMLSLADLLKTETLSETEKSKAFDLIGKLAQMITDAHNKEQEHKHEIKKYLIKGGVILGSLILVVITAGRIKIDTSKFIH